MKIKYKSIPCEYSSYHISQRKTIKFYKEAEEIFLIETGFNEIPSIYIVPFGSLARNFSWASEYLSITQEELTTFQNEPCPFRSIELVYNYIHKYVNLNHEDAISQEPYINTIWEDLIQEAIENNTLQVIRVH